MPDEAQPARCSGCGSNSEGVHDQGWRTIRDLSMLGNAVWLRLRLRRVRCAACGPRMERARWQERHAPISARFVGRRCDKLPIAHVCQQPDALPMPEPRHLIVAEFSPYKGHCYTTVIANTRHVQWIGEGRSREAVRPFFDELG
ncbi:transposase family protein [Trinickia fusca]|uniref:transposase family protein n=1 Tax=Trinickia fusca TaxID=2419777 RepID=UPI001FE352B5|nr:transposase family protein [Trinickia fusca]